jgi:hypothetical protein
VSESRIRLVHGKQSLTQWFASRSDLIVLLFDAHKLDISDEFRAVIQRLKGHADKIRCVLNIVISAYLCRLCLEGLCSRGRWVDREQHTRCMVMGAWDLRKQ